MRRLLSLAMLLLRVVWHFLKIPFRRAPVHERRFLENYAPEGLVPLASDARRLLPRIEGCIGCGLCTALCPHWAEEGQRHRFGAPSFLVMSARSFPEFHAFRSETDDGRACARCTCEAVCPVGIPLRDFAALVRGMGGARPTP